MPGTQTYQIKLEGHLDPQWSDWFDGWTLTHAEDGSTLLTGLAPDQAALHGLFVKIRNLNLKLISVNPVAPGQEVTVQMFITHRV